jgi:hypothetical protein
MTTGDIRAVSPLAQRLFSVPAQPLPQRQSHHDYRNADLQAQPGKRAEFLEIFRSKSMPAHADIGMKILGPFLSIEDSDTFFFMRGFPDVASREPMKARFYEGELWKRELENVLMPMLDRYDVVVVVSDPGGQIR